MKPLDFLRAATIALGVFLGTLLFSIPMVAFYAYVIERGHPPEFYNAAAKWIAPWSSHIVGPLLFFGLNYRRAVRHPERSSQSFAATTILFYIAIDLSSVPLFGIAFSSVLRVAFFISLAVKAAGALVGAKLGTQKAAAKSAAALARR